MTEKNNFWNELSASEQNEIKKGIVNHSQGERVSND
jgi:hypothetical protein